MGGSGGKGRRGGAGSADVCSRMEWQVVAGAGGGCVLVMVVMYVVVVDKSVSRIGAAADRA